MQVRFSHNIEKSLHSVSKKKLYSLHCRSRDCKLFAARDIAEWERQMAEMQPERQMRIAARPTGATVRCPKCRARNFKVTAALSLSLSLSVGNYWIWAAELMWRWEVYFFCAQEDERYIFCWACRDNYCTLCRRKVNSRKSGHYGSPECMGLDNFEHLHTFVMTYITMDLFPWFSEQWMWRSVHPVSKT